MAISVQNKRPSAVEDRATSPASSLAPNPQPDLPVTESDQILVLPEEKTLLFGRTSDQMAGLAMDLALPILVAVVTVVSGFLTVQRVNALIGWEATFTGSGNFVVSSCEQFDQWGPDQWHCMGRLTTGGESTTVQATTMVVSRGAMPSFRPYVGQEWEVFFAPAADAESSPDFVYADQLQLSEITRLYISIFPRVLLTVGTACWLLGWWFSRRYESKPQDWWVNRLPGMQQLQRRSAMWILVAVVVYLVYRLIAYYFLGSVGVA